GDESSQLIEIISFQDNYGVVRPSDHVGGHQLDFVGGQATNPANYEVGGTDCSFDKYVGSHAISSLFRDSISYLSIATARPNLVCQRRLVAVDNQLVDCVGPPRSGVQLCRGGRLAATRPCAQFCGDHPRFDGSAVCARVTIHASLP